MTSRGDCWSGSKWGAMDALSCRGPEVLRRSPVVSFDDQRKRCRVQRTKAHRAVLIV